jgi:RHS repeat-associated protein
MTNDSGSLEGSIIRFEPFGDYRPGSGPGDITDRGFTGHEHNDYVKMIYMGARWYLPGLGRFASADTIVPSPANPQSFNRFSYVYNSPLNLVDPSGHCAVDANGNIAVDENGELLKTDCTVDDFQNLTWDQRLQWLDIFVATNGLADWFNDIRGAILELSSDPDYQQMDGWAAYLDAGILQAINDGMRLYDGYGAIGHTLSNGQGYSTINGGAGWRDFFRNFYAGMAEDPLIVSRLRAEQMGVDYALSLPETDRRYQSSGTRVQIKVDTFLWGADRYRDFGRACRSYFAACTASFGPGIADYTDPRKALQTQALQTLAGAPEPASWVLYGQLMQTCVGFNMPDYCFE